MKIVDVRAVEIINSRAEPTINCSITLENGVTVSASVPSGASKGAYEVHELRDGVNRLRGLGVQRAVFYINNTISPELLGKDLACIDLDKWLQSLDDTSSYELVGGNTLLAVSIALYKAAAVVHNIPLYEFIAYACNAEHVALPLPMFNMINGGKHAPTTFPIQELLIIPCGCSSFTQAMEVGLEFFYLLQRLFLENDKTLVYGQEGGLIASFNSLNEPFDLLVKVIKKIEEQYGFYCMIALDVAASSFFSSEKQAYRWFDKWYSSSELITVYKELLAQYPIYSIEDGLAQDDWSGWQHMNNELHEKVHLFGDDLTVTQFDRVIQAHETNCADGVIIKPNQVGTVTKAIQTALLCKQIDAKTVVSHRSGDTCDNFIADLAVGTCASFIKAGGFMHSERTSKYNRLVVIEDELLRSQNKEK